VPWPVAGALFVAGTTAYAAVRAVSASSGDTVVVAGAAGGVGSITVQLAILAGATVIGLASKGNHAWLKGLGVVPVSYGDGDGDGVAERIVAAASGGVDALIDLAGGYVQLALDLGVEPERVDTIVDFGAGEKYGVKTEGTAAAANAGVLAELAKLIDDGRLDVPIARVYPLEQVREAFRELEQGHTRGKIVLEP
jgi:NADPH:quinone reductase-like Zn-dependent oxidoreductase